MSIFNNTLSFDGEETVGTLLSENFYDIGGDCDMMLESLVDDLAVIESLHAIDIAETNGLETISVTTENAVGELEVVEESVKSAAQNVWAKIKEIALKVINAIKTFFTNIINKVKLFGYNNSKFVEKNKTAILAAKISKKEKVNAYPWNFKKLNDVKYVDNAKSFLTGIEVTAQYALKFTGSEVKDINKDLENADVAAKARGVVVGGSKEISPEQFTKALFKRFHGADVKSDIDVNKQLVSEAVSFLEGTKNLAKNLMDAQKTLNATASKQLAVIKQCENQATSSDSKLSAQKATIVRKSMQLFNGIQSSVNTMVRSHLSAVKECATFSVSVCKKVMTDAK